MIVLDASVVVELLLKSSRYAVLRRRFESTTSTLCAPHLLDVEVAQVLRRFVLRGEVTAHRARQALGDLELLPLVRYAHLPLLRRAFQFLQNLTVYEAIYLSLAEALQARLLTADRAFLTCSKYYSKIEVIR